MDTMGRWALEASLRLAAADGGAGLSSALPGSQRSCFTPGTIHQANCRRGSAKSEVKYLLSVWNAKLIMLRRHLTKPQTQSY